MSSVHCVVVWEWQSNGQWLPHTPSVTRTLERAHAKKLTRVVLADADPALKGYYVNLLTLTQSNETPDGGILECGVRRSCYSVQSVAGRGWCWEWARFMPPPGAGELLYEPLPLDKQCHLEESWSRGIEVVTLDNWVVSLSCMTGRSGAAVRLLRRAPHPPYPLTLTPQPPPPPNLQRQLDVRKSRIPQQHTGASCHSAHSAPPALPAPPAPPRSASPKDRKPGIARQILHNLNIFSNNNKSPGGCARDAECTSTGSGGGRRHSVDTVSTYLSHESKDSLQQAAVGELLNCSGGSDDVFESPAPSADELDLSDETVDESWWAAVREWTRRGAPRGPCALCDVTVQGGRALARCGHALHAACLARRLRALARAGEPLHVECGACGHSYGAPGPPPRAAPRPPLCNGAQPRGSMSWRLQPVSLPQFEYSSSILVTYNFQSGTQGAAHPAPGSPYYAVGFPRHSLLPDTQLGRQVVVSLRLAWERGLLFVVRTSRTTGREHVVAWSCPPPPPSRAAHYRPPARPADLLADLLQRLHRLAHPALPAHPAHPALPAHPAHHATAP